MHPIKATWKAYPMDRSGIKTCQRGEVIIWSPYRLIKVSEVLDQVRLQVQDAHPELRSCPIQLIDFRFLEQEAA